MKPLEAIVKWWQAIKTNPPLFVTTILLAIYAIIPITWFPSGKIIFSGDPVVALDPIRFFWESWSLWQGRINLGSETKVATSSLIHQLIQAIPAFFGASDRTVEILHFTFWFILPGITLALFMTALAKRLKISLWSVPVAVTFYLFNLYRMANFGDNNHFAIYAVVPLALYWITRAYNEPRTWLTSAAALALSSLLAAQSGSNPPMYLMLWLPVAIYGFILGVVEWRNWKRTVAFWLVSLLGIILVNMFWLLPFLLILANQSSLGSAGNLNWLADLSRHTSLDRVVRQMGAWSWFDNWRGEPYFPYNAMYAKPFWQNLTLIPALLVPVALLFKKGRKPAVFALLLIAFIGLAYAQGTHPPFGQLFEWSAENLPFFWIFRSPWYKFSNMQALGYATLIGLGIGFLADWLTATRLRFLMWPMLLLVLIVPLLITKPMLTGAMWPTTKTVGNLPPWVIPYPTHIRTASDWLNAQPGNTAVALLPYQGSAVYDWGYASLLDPIDYFSRRPLFERGDRIGYVPGQTPGASVMYRIFKERLYSDDPSAAKVARLLGIEYIVVRNDIRYKFYDDTDSPAFLKEKLAKQSEIDYVRSFGAWDIYKLQNAITNPVFATNWSQLADAHVLDSYASILETKKPTDPYPAIIYSRPLSQPDPIKAKSIVDQLNRTGAVPQLAVTPGYNRYSVRGKASEPFLLVLNQSFNPNWRIKAKNKKITLTGPVIVNGYAPAWLVQAQGDFDITIDYAPQRQVVPLVVISLITILTLSYVIVKNRQKRQTS